jgi:hypothetical protein
LPQRQQASATPAMIPWQAQLMVSRPHGAPTLLRYAYPTPNHSWQERYQYSLVARPVMHGFWLGCAQHQDKRETIAESDLRRGYFAPRPLRQQLASAAVPSQQDPEDQSRASSADGDHHTLAAAAQTAVGADGVREAAHHVTISGGGADSRGRRPDTGYPHDDDEEEEEEEEDSSRVHQPGRPHSALELRGEFSVEDTPLVARHYRSTVVVAAAGRGGRQHRMGGGGSGAAVGAARAIRQRRSKPRASWSAASTRVAEARRLLHEVAG